MRRLTDTVTLERVAVPLWAWFVVALAALMLYALTLENGAMLASSASALHELFHDARHFAGTPCH